MSEDWAWQRRSRSRTCKNGRGGADARPEAEAQSALPATPLFSELSPESLTRVIEDASLMQHEAGAVVYRTGDASDALYVLVNGAVSVHADGERRVVSRHASLARSTRTSSRGPVRLARMTLVNQ